ncbi:MAG TPA: RecT family recombinase [Jatrophihabitantaceae bacterium]|jgi:recombination protein RecT
MTDTTTTDPGKAVARRETGPEALIRQYSDDFATVLPSHIKAATWVRVAQGALKKGKKTKVRNAKGDYVEVFELELAAHNNPAAFVSALLDAARQGLEPGTEQYYLTPRKVGSQLEILGMRGYQGEVELMYRAGAVSSVIVEVVRDRDTFIWTPGKIDHHQPPRWQGPMERPYHEVDWFGEDRGDLRGVYAYAVMKDGATSRVVILNRRDIDRIKSFAQGTKSEYSPWNTSEESMWLKSGAHQLRKWVPTSAEYITTQVRAVREGNTPDPVSVAPLRVQQDMPDVNPDLNGDTFIAPDTVDAEVVPDDEPPADDTPPPEPGPEMASKVQVAKLNATLNGYGIRERERRLAVISQVLDRAVESQETLTKQEASTVIDTLEQIQGGREAFEAIFGGGS